MESDSVNLQLESAVGAYNTNSAQSKPENQVKTKVTCSTMTGSPSDQQTKNDMSSAKDVSNISKKQKETKTTSTGTSPPPQSISTQVRKQLSF